MALVLYEDFQSFSVGDPGPYGSLSVPPGAIGVAISNTAGADGIQGPYGKTKYVSGQSGAIYFNDLTFRSTLTILIASRQPTLPNLGNLFELCGKIGSGAGGFEWLGIAIAPDSTLVPLFAGNPIGIPGNFSFAVDNWNFIQLNAEFTQPGGVGTPVTIAWNVWIDGKLDINGAYNTIPITVGPGFISVIGIGGFAPALTSCQFGEVSIYDTLQAAAFFPNPGSSLARSTNQVIEVVTVPGAPPPLDGTCPAPGTGVVGEAFSEFVSGVDGVPPYTYALADATSLPPGLSLNTSTGEVHGTPTLAGTYSTHYAITDADDTTVIIHCSITITEIGGVCPTDVATVGTTYSHSVTPVGGTGPFTYVLADGTTLPPGLSLNTSSGLISGIPTTIGSYGYHILITDSLGATTKAICTIVVGPPAPPGRFCVGQA